MLLIATSLFLSDFDAFCVLAGVIAQQAVPLVFGFLDGVLRTSTGGASFAGTVCRCSLRTQDTMHSTLYFSRFRTQVIDRYRAGWI